MLTGQDVLMKKITLVEEHFFLGGRLVAWHNKKQDSVYLSTAEVEYIAAKTCCSQVLWMIQTLKDIKVQVSQPIHILCDNTSTINISKNLVMHSRTKHIAIHYHFLRKKVITNEVVLDYVASCD